MGVGVSRAFIHGVLRITTKESSDSVLLKLEGGIKGPWVDELEKTWSALAKDTPVKVDLSAVSFVDERGSDLLLRIQKNGGVLEGASAFLTSMFQRKIQQPGKRS